MSLQTQRLDNSLRIMYYYKWRVNQTQLALEPVITCFIRLFFLVVGLALDCKPKALHMANKHHLLSFLKPPSHSKGSGFSHLLYHPSSQIAEDSWSLWVQGFFFLKTGLRLIQNSRFSLHPQGLQIQSIISGWFQCFVFNLPFLLSDNF